MKTLLVQFPVPKLNFGLQTGNVPLGPACLKSAAPEDYQDSIYILPESVISYIGDSASLDLILSLNPDTVCFTLFSWNISKSLYIAEILKKKGISIAFGGPEATPDNTKVINSCADFTVFGEGESFFKKFIAPDKFKKEEKDDCFLFKNMSSPYVKGLLEPEIQDSMLVETQRGCPYSCGYCYYSKSRSKVCVRPEEKVFEAVEYALDKKISEVYFLDPSLNSRPDLKRFLKKLSQINKNNDIRFHSEIRAEYITDELAELFLKSGFLSFEVGLQSVNPAALSIMKRPTDLSAFLKGINALKKVGISPCIDLIAGLPGDNPGGIKSSVDFICENMLEEDVQFFPLSVIPGTDFRLNYKSLGLNFSPDPPYNIISTNTFTEEDIMMSFEYAEQMLGISFFPQPDIDLSYKSRSLSMDVNIKTGGNSYTSKVVFLHKREPGEIENVSKRLTSPYQVFFGSEISDIDYICRAVEILSENNPFTPFEIVFFDPKFMPDQNQILNFCRLKRPHFLDGDLRYLYPGAGNRAVLFTVASSENYYDFCGPMEREVLIWKHDYLPDINMLYSFEKFSGILIDNNLDNSFVHKWQKEMAEHCENLLHISFADVYLQAQWVEMTLGDTYYSKLFFMQS
ncbi:MAG: B12-binding domain-containing radical SAM protein [Thermodesulfobacteriota bacterium]